MVPAFGVHLLLAILAAFALRGGRAAAVAACLVVGNPLTHAAIVPLAYEIGRFILPGVPAPFAGRLPAWVADALSVAEEALAGGVALGLVTGPVAFLVVRAALRRRARQPLPERPDNGTGQRRAPPL
jgi:uncharacterized protein (DUF2062 family)